MSFTIVICNVMIEIPNCGIQYLENTNEPICILFTTLMLDTSIKKALLYTRLL